MTVSETTAKGSRSPFYTLRYPNFRLYWVGMLISFLGTWMQNIALPWLTLTLTNDALLVSLVSAMQYVPALIFSLFSGAILDRVNKKNVLIVTQIGFTLVSLGFVVMVYSGHVLYWVMLVLAFVYGIFNAFDSPCRQSFILELVEKKEDIPNAIALNSLSFNATRVIGPSIAGLIMAQFGVGVCFLINAISFLFVLVSLFFIKTRPMVVEIHYRSILEGIKDGVKYVQARTVLSVSLIVLLIVTTFIPNYNILNSALAKYTFNGNETTYGYLMSFMGIGAFFGALYFAIKSKEGPNRRLMLMTALGTGVATMLAGTAQNLVASGIFQTLNGFFLVLFTSQVNATLQLNSDNAYRGRVMSIYSLFYQGSTPIGNLFAGFFTNQFNARIGFYACGVAVLVLLSALGVRSREKVKDYLQT